MPLFRRFDRPGLLGSVAPSAIVAGTASMKARAVDRGRSAQTGDDGTGPDLSGTGTSGRAKTARGGAAPVSPQLGMLTSLHDSGAISDVEFVKATKRVLGV